MPQKRDQQSNHGLSKNRLIPPIPQQAAISKSQSVSQCLGCWEICDRTPSGTFFAVFA